MILISWYYTYNSNGYSKDELSAFSYPPYRIGEAWLDNVSILPLTLSFAEGWESQDFAKNNWILSGEAQWTVTDTVKQSGSYSATVSSKSIAAAGAARLSIVIITEQGGTMTYWILPHAGGPFCFVNVLVDDVIQYTYSIVGTEWMNQDIEVQPGWREVSFELSKIRKP